MADKCGEVEKINFALVNLRLDCVVMFVYWRMISVFTRLY